MDVARLQLKCCLKKKSYNRKKVTTEEIKSHSFNLSVILKQLSGHTRLDEHSVVLAVFFLPSSNLKEKRSQTKLLLK